MVQAPNTPKMAPEAPAEIISGPKSSVNKFPAKPLKKYMRRYSGGAKHFFRSKPKDKQKEHVA